MTAPNRSTSAEPGAGAGRGTGAGAWEPLTIVGIGASAGGLDALRRLLGAVPADSGMAWVVITHLDPDSESQLPVLLGRAAAIPVRQVTRSVRVEANHVYVIPPHHDLTVVDGTVELTTREGHATRAPIDLFLRALAEANGPGAVGVVLSGTGTDGTEGLRRIKEVGGVTVAQDPAEAEFPAMPKSAIDTRQVDLVLPAAEIPGELLRMKRAVVPRIEGASGLGAGGAGAGGGGADSPPPHDAEAGAARGAVVGGDAAEGDDRSAGERGDTAALEQLLDYLRAATGHDFSRYKRATVLRRIMRRIRFRNVQSVPEYRDLLRADAEELQRLHGDLLISVSSFFRDPETFEVLEKDVIPALFEGKGPDDAVRVWVAGCATGEEAYTLAMLLAECAASRPNPPTVKIFATDIDADALTIARKGHYLEAIADHVSPERLERFFTREHGGYRVRRILRKLILFAEHDVLNDPPFSRADLISCRNVLIYLNPDAQDGLMESFHYALAAGGFLLLGTAETPGSADGLFTPADRKQRIFRRVEVSRRVLPRAASAGPRERRPAPEGGAEGRATADFSYGSLHLRMVEAYAPPSVVVNRNYELVHLSDHAGRYLRLGGGEPTRSLLDLAPDALRPALRRALYEAFHKEQSTVREVRIRADSDAGPVDLHVRVLDSTEAGGPFALVVFEEQAPRSEAAEVPTDPADVLSFAEFDEELSRTRKQLQAVIEERDSMIEELQSSNEELQSINEEQKATAEEMEVSREELQSVNEELTTVNEEHRGTITELGEINADIQNLILSTGIATIFLDPELRILRFTPTVEGLFNLLPTDQGRPLSHVTHSLRYDKLMQDAEQVLDTLHQVEREIETEAGDWYMARISPYRSIDGDVDGLVLTFAGINAQKEVERSLRTLEARLRLVLDSADLGIWELDLESHGLEPSGEQGRIFGYEEGIPQPWNLETFLDHVHPEDRAQVEETFRNMRTANGRWEFECRIVRGDGELRWLRAHGAISRDAAGKAVRALGVGADVTSRKLMEEELRRAKLRAEEASQAKSRFIATLSHDFRTPLHGIMGYADVLTLGDGLTSEKMLSVERIRGSVAHLSTMLEEILAFAKLESGQVTVKLESFDARDVAREAVAVLGPAAAMKSLAFDLHLPEEAVGLVTDRGKARQILLNLLGNAVKYTRRGSIVLTVREQGDSIAFEIRDTGIGIAPEHMERIFELFHQVEDGTARPGGGTGIGLTAARNFSHLLGGDIEAESELDRGSTFTLSLPRSGPPPPGG
jgi:two-component system, chemotaxis family, CheB/CheR fusion protein